MTSRQEFVEFLLALFLLCMIAMEPFLHCLNVDPRWVANCCDHGEFYCTLSDNYDRTSALLAHLFYSPPCSPQVRFIVKMCWSCGK